MFHNVHSPISNSYNSKTKTFYTTCLVSVAADSLIADGQAEFLIDETRQNSWITYMNTTLKNLFHTNT